MTVEDCTADVLVGCTDAELLNSASPERLLVSHVVTSGSALSTVGVYLNLELNIVQYIVEGLPKLATIHRKSSEETPELIPAIEVKDMATLSVNFGYEPFKFNVHEFCKQTGWPSSQLPTTAALSKLFWSFPSNCRATVPYCVGLQKYRTKPVKMEVEERFTSIFTSKEGSLV